jgi:Holliday junction resolvase-like predicted endonuclease
MAAVQNNASAALNNLRRIGARRPEAREETRRIEQRLAECFEERGFCVCLNYQPARTLDDDPGEVDLICMRDGQLLVLEVKSTFLRRSIKDVWLHKTTTLRKAGLQLRRKVRAVQEALLADEDLAHTLGLENNTVMPAVRGWIVDTSLEHDHERFSGFMKVSVEEVLIALRDDRHWLNDPKDWFSNQRDRQDDALSESQVTSTLYPNGFSGNDFIDVIEQQAVWAE